MVIYLNRKSFLAFLWKWSWQPIKHQPGLEPQTTSERPSCNLHAYLGTSILIVLFEEESAFWLHVHVLMFPLCDKRFHKKMHQIKNGHGDFIKLVDCGGNFLSNNRKIWFTVQNHHDYNSRSLIIVFNNEITIKGLYMEIPRPKSEVYFTYFCMGYGRIPADVHGIQKM